MICLLSLLVFSVMGIFSATHRELAREAFDCVTSKARNQPCETDLEDRLRASVVGKTLDYDPRLAKFLSDHFELLSWILTLILLATGAYSAFSLYNYAVYGNCAGAAAQKGCSIGTGVDLVDRFLNLCESAIESVR
ncbi:MAG: hypothetical protein ABEJ98_05545 [Candidatus Nanohaloarchaea archaeon]